MKSRLIETLLGGAVFVIALYFLVFAWQATNIHNANRTIQVYGSYTSVGSLEQGAPIKIGGYTVGYVNQMSIDSQTYLVRVPMDVDESIKIPEDSIFSITANGLLGKNFISISVGHSSTMLKNGEKVKKIKNAYGLEDVVASFINNQA